MIILLSPSKTLSKRPAPEMQGTTPKFLARSEQLVDSVRGHTKDLADLLGVSEKIADLNRERYVEWSASAHDTNGKPVIYAFASDVYNGLAAFDMSEDDIDFAQEHLRIVSGLYGILKPSDQILPHRLEMSTRLAGSWGRNLYDFWGDALASEIESENPGFILNCASDEYAKAVLPHFDDSLEVITPRFLHDSGGGAKPKAKMTFAKYTRGLMARWAIENRITSVEEVLGFNAEGYVYRADLSEPAQPVFVAPQEFSLKGRFIKF